MKALREVQIRDMLFYAHQEYGFNQVKIFNHVLNRFDFYNEHSPNSPWGEDELEFARKVLWEEIKPEEYMGYSVVNTDLNMSAGKIAAQVAHGAVRVTLNCTTNTDEPQYIIEGESPYKRFSNWLSQGGAKVVLGATTEQMEQIVQNVGYTKEVNVIVDEGRTEDTEDKMTVLSFNPMKRKHAKELIGHLHALGYDPSQTKVKYK